MLSSRGDIWLERQRQLAPVLKHDRFELSLALAGADTRSLVSLARPRLQPCDRERREPAALPLAAVFDIQVAETLVDRGRDVGYRRSGRRVVLEEKAVRRPILVADQEEERRGQA